MINPCKQFELNFEENDALKKLIGKFRHAGAVYSTLYKDYHDDIWIYGRVKVIFHKGPWTYTADVTEDGDRVCEIEDLLTISNEELARRILGSCKSLS